MTFAEQLREIMERENLSQKELAEKIDICESTVSKYLNGKIIPSYETADRIFQDLGYTLHPLQDMGKDLNNDQNLRKNGSGYSDPTAYNAIKKMEKDRERLMKLLDTIFTICDYAGFHVEERIVLKDRKTGKVWR